YVPVDGAKPAPSCTSQPNGLHVVCGAGEREGAPLRSTREDPCSVLCHAVSTGEHVGKPLDTPGCSAVRVTVPYEGTHRRAASAQTAVAQEDKSRQSVGSKPTLTWFAGPLGGALVGIPGNWGCCSW